MTSTNRKLASGVALAVIAAGALAAWDSTNFTMMERRWQPAPSGHTPGKDGDGAGDGSHHPGEDCGICHAPPSADPLSVYTPAASGRVFTLTATFMDSRAGRRPVPGGEIIVQDYAGNVVSFVANDVGNAWTEAAIAPDATVAAPQIPEESWRYKAWIKAEGVARPMMTMPTVGGMRVPRMSCGMHHVQTGTMGALAAAPGATLRSYPSSGLSFRKHVFPILRSKCAPCHVPGPTVASQNGETFDYGSDLDLMNLDGSSVTIHGTVGETVYTKVGVRQFVTPAAPDASLVLSKGLPGSTHGGGVFWTQDHPDYRAIRQWIAEGASDN